MQILITYFFLHGKVGVEHWENSPIDQDILVFLCDVDVSFDSAFIDRCRRNAQPKRNQHYSISFVLTI